MSRDRLSQDSLAEASRSRVEFSGHRTRRGRAVGAAGHRVPSSDPNCEYLSQPGQMGVIQPRTDGFGKIVIGVAWDRMVVERPGFWARLLKKTKAVPVDVDLGCLYETKDGRRGAIQALGELYGHYNDFPFVHHRGDERSGDKDGLDEVIEINGLQWNDISRVLIYVYIYHGAPDWQTVRPQVQLHVPGEMPMIVTPAVTGADLSVCAVAMLENRNGGMRLSNHTEYFAGHAEMDRAFGFGLHWEEGQK